MESSAKALILYIVYIHLGILIEAFVPLYKKLPPNELLLKVLSTK